MRFLIFTVLLILRSGAVLGADASKYFPSSFDSFKEQWYSEQLRALGEAPMCCAKGATIHAYRFTWLRTFHRPVAISVSQDAKGNWAIHTKVTDGAGGYSPGKLVVNESRPLSADAAGALQRLLEPGSSFWTLPSEDKERFGFDGSQWIVEARSGDSYHYVDRWTPDKGPVRDIGLMFMKLSGKEFGKVY